MKFSVSGNSGPPIIVHLPFGPRLDKGCRPLIYMDQTNKTYIYLLNDLVSNVHNKFKTVNSKKLNDHLKDGSERTKGYQNLLPPFRIFL